MSEIESAGLRGRGGGGYPTHLKWRAVQRAAFDQKYIICNGDEGDPGAFMDRMLMESYPYRVLEGMAIAAWTVGANTGVLYIRSEYPLALERINKAIETCKQRGCLGRNILGTDFSLDLRVYAGAGAFVCGEETSLIKSIEGKRPTPRLRPPYPTQSGLNQQPTLVNNVETYALVSWVLRNGAAAFSELGTSGSKGTKVFALAGKIRRGGLIEVPMGMTVRQIVDDIGGGIENDTNRCILPVRLWVQAAWWFLTKPTAWSISPAISWNSRRINPADAVRSAELARSGCSKCWNGFALDRANPAISKNCRNWAR
ncbi:MAG: hypothetical protein ACYSOZ_06160 [Planctomycetota bacterium]